MNRSAACILAFIFLASSVALAGPDDDKSFNGLGVTMGNLSRLSKAQTRSISPENFTGEKGKAGMSTDGAALNAARDLGQGWKVSPYVVIPPKSTFVLADVKGTGRHPADLDDARGDLALRHPPHLLGRRDRAVGRMPARRFLRLRLGPLRPDLLARRLRQSRQRLQLLLGDALPQVLQDDPREHRRREVHHLLPDQLHPDRRSRRTRPISTPSSAASTRCLTKRFTPSSTASRAGGITSARIWPGASTTTAGGARARSSSSSTATTKFPTIAGTGTEDYFCGSYDFDTKRPDGTVQYTEFTTPYSGLAQVIRGDGHYDVQQRFGLYRWHIMDPIRFAEGPQGDHPGARLASAAAATCPLQDDISSTAFWYQTEPHAKFPTLPDKDSLEII